MLKIARNKVVSIVQLDGTDQLVITGPFGHAVCKANNPTEIGLRITEVMTGDTLAPPLPYENRPVNVTLIKGE